MFLAKASYFLLLLNSTGPLLILPHLYIISFLVPLHFYFISHFLIPPHKMALPPEWFYCRNIRIIVKVVFVINIADSFIVMSKLHELPGRKYRFCVF